MIRINSRARWLAIGLLALGACSGGAGGGWGSRARSISWDTNLTEDPAMRIPGVAKGAITKVDLQMGDKGVVCIALWTTGSTQNCSSGGGPASGCFMRGDVAVNSVEPVPFSFSASDGVRALGSIGDEEFAVEKSGLFLIREGADGVVVKQVDVPAEALEPARTHSSARRKN